MYVYLVKEMIRFDEAFEEIYVYLYSWTRSVNSAYLTELKCEIILPIKRML